MSGFNISTAKAVKYESYTRSARAIQGDYYCRNIVFFKQICRQIGSENEDEDRAHTQEKRYVLANLKAQKKIQSLRRKRTNLNAMKQGSNYTIAKAQPGQPVKPTKLTLA